MRADIITLHKNLEARIKLYKSKFKKEPNTEGVAQLLANTLYGRRFFPFYAFNALAGLDSKGAGVVYGYDAIGSYDKVVYGGQGSGSELIFPVLDKSFKGHNHLSPQLPENI